MAWSGNGAECMLCLKICDASSCTNPTQTFNNGNYTIGGSALNLSTLFTSNSSGAVTYTVQNANGTGASIAGTSFTATTAGTATVRASQAADGDYCAKTIDATITVEATCAYAANPTISAIGPASTNTCAGNTVDLTATVSDATSYQWYSNTVNNTSTGTPVGTSSNTYRATVTGTQTYYYVVATNCHGSTTSSTVSVIGATVSASLDDASDYASFQNCGNESSTASMTGGTAASYQWYSNTTNNNTSGSVIAGATSATYTFPTTTTGTKYYYCVVTSTSGCTATTPTRKVTVNEAAATECETLVSATVSSASTMTASVGGVSVSNPSSQSNTTVIKLNSSGYVLLTPKAGSSFQAGDTITVTIYNQASSAKTTGFNLGSGASYTKSIAKQSTATIGARLVASDIVDGKVKVFRNSSDGWIGGLIKIEHCGAACTPPTKLELAGTAPSVNINTPLALSVANGNGGSIEWTASPATATFTGNITDGYVFTPSEAGSYRIIGVQAAHCGYCETKDTINVTVNSSATYVNAEPTAIMVCGTVYYGVGTGASSIRQNNQWGASSTNVTTNGIFSRVGDPAEGGTVNGTPESSAQNPISSGACYGAEEACSMPQGPISSTTLRPTSHPSPRPYLRTPTLCASRLRQVNSRSTPRALSASIRTVPPSISALPREPRQ